MLRPQQIARRLIEGTLTAPKAVEHLKAVNNDEKFQFMEDIIFVCGLTSPDQPKLGSMATHYERGIDVLAELFSMTGNGMGLRLVNDSHAAFFRDVRSGPLERDRLPAHLQMALTHLYEHLQAKSPLAALNFLTRGLIQGRSEAIHTILAPSIDKALILETAVIAKRIDFLYNKMKWDECVPLLTSKGRDRFFSGELGL